MASRKKVQLLFGHQDGEFHRLAGLVEMVRSADLAAGFPGVLVLHLLVGVDRDLAELFLAQPENVAVVAALPGGLFRPRLSFPRHPPRPSSSARASSCAALRPRPNPSAARRSRAPSRSASHRAACAPGAASLDSSRSPRAARGSFRPGP